MGIQAEVARRPDQGLSGAGHQPQPGHLRETIIDTSADDFVFALDAMSGKLLWETRIVDFRKNPAQETSGPIIANGKIISTRGCEPKGGPEACVITAHDAKTGKELWRSYTIPKPGEPGERNVGRYSLREPLARRRLDGAQLRPGVQSPLRRHVGDVAGTEVHARRQRQTVPLSQLHARHGRRHRQDRLVLPAHRRSLGFGSSIRTAAGRHRGAPGPGEGHLDQSEAQGWERRKVVTGIPGKTGIVYTLDRQTGEFLWARRPSART